MRTLAATTDGHVALAAVVGCVGMNLEHVRWNALIWRSTMLSLTFGCFASLRTN
jgi:hypothetical protein